MPGRVQLAPNVNDIGQADGFYTKLLGAILSKPRPGYASLAIADAAAGRTGESVASATARC